LASIRSAIASRRAKSLLLVSAARAAFNASTLRCAAAGSDPRAPEDYDCVANAVLFKQQFGLEIVDLQADAPHAGSRQEIEVNVGPAIALAFKNCLDARGRLRVFFQWLWVLPRKRLSPIQWAGRLWNTRPVRV
jgi:hypothetical protein